MSLFDINILIKNERLFIQFYNNEKCLDMELSYLNAKLNVNIKHM